MMHYMLILLVLSLKGTKALKDAGLDYSNIEQAVVGEFTHSTSQVRARVKFESSSSQGPFQFFYFLFPFFRFHFDIFNCDSCFHNYAWDNDVPTAAPGSIHYTPKAIFSLSTRSREFTHNKGPRQTKYFQDL